MKSRNKPVKIYFHHGMYQEVDNGHRWSPAVRMLLAPLRGIYWFCFGIGYFFLATLYAPLWFIKSLFRVGGNVKQLRTLVRQRPFLRTIGVFLVFALLAGGLVQSARFVASGQQLKGRVLGTADEGLESLRAAQNSLENQNIGDAQNHLSLALSRFQKSEQELNSSGVILKSLLAVVPQKRDADSLLQAAQLLTEAGLEGAQAYELLSTAKFSAEGLSGIDDPHNALINLGDYIGRSADKLTEATELLKSINPSTLPSDKQLLFIQTRDALVAMEANMGALREVFGLIQNIFLGDKRVLLLMQNSNELRPTGGFIGTFGNAAISDGKIKSLDIRSIYDLDGQLQEWIIPPRPILKVNDHWFMRDANWWTDFPTSAKKVIQFYEKEGGETPDLTVAVTPQVIVDMLTITGPITMSRYGVVLDAANFIEQTQTTTSVYYDKSLNQPKQMLADFFPALFQKFSEGSGSTTLSLLELLSRNLLQKNILLYSNNSETQQQLESFNWAGSVKTTDRDYLLISSSNLGGSKTDSFLERSVNLLSSINPSGAVRNVLTLEIKNPLPKNPGLSNTSFIRVYVPQGSRLIGALGFDNEQLPQIKDSKAQIDADVLTWEQGTMQNTVSGTTIGLESGKTFFGNWLTVPGGETKTITIEYELPFAVQKLDHFSLLLQKQPGQNAFPFKYQINYSSYNLMWQNTSLESSGNHASRWQSTVASDQFLGFVFQQPQ
jgi:hypothetical protein